MKRHLTRKSCLLSFFAVVLLVSMGLAAYGEGRPDGRSGPYWATWLGIMAFNILLVLVGSSILIATIIRPDFVIELRRLGDEEPRYVTRSEIIRWRVIAIGMILAGIIFFWNALYGLMMRVEAH